MWFPNSRLQALGNTIHTYSDFPNSRLQALGNTIHTYSDFPNSRLQASSIVIGLRIFLFVS